MELHPGVFVSSVLTDDWQPDPEVGGEAVHVLVEEETAYCGMSRFMTGASAWSTRTPPERDETVIVLEGAARIQIEGGPSWN